MRRGSQQGVRSFRRAALAAIVALAAYVLVPYVHALSGGCAAGPSGCRSERPAPSHSPECAVCGVLAHAGARAADTPAALAVALAPVALSAAPRLPELRPPLRAREARCARAPPLRSRSV